MNNFERLDREVKISAEELDGFINVNSYLNDNRHEMKINLKVDPISMVIKDIEVEMIRAPYEICQKALLPINSLIGLTVKSGINKQVIEIMGRTKGCVHIIDLLRDTFKGVMQGRFRYNVKNLEPDERIKQFEEKLKGTCVRYV